jgi:hypothetical protein
MAEDCDTCSGRRAKDWASDWRAFVGLWGVPAGAMLAALMLEPAWRTIVWTVMLGWMGGACLVNARRCSRTHCRITGPFLLGMAALVAGYGAGVVPLGANGWTMLGSATAIGFAGLWWASERLWGAFSPAPRTSGK